MIETFTGETKQDLKNKVEHIESLLLEKENLNKEIKEAFEVAKNAGFDVKAMKEVIKLRKKDPQKAINEEDMREIYKDLLIEI